MRPRLRNPEAIEREERAQLKDADIIAQYAQYQYLRDLDHVVRMRTRGTELTDSEKDEIRAFIATYTPYRGAITYRDIVKG